MQQRVLELVHRAELLALCALALERVVQVVLRGLLRRDVQEEALRVQRGSVLIVHDDRDVSDPQDVAVAVHETVGLVEGGAVLDVPALGRPAALPVLGVDEAGPQVRVLAPVLGGVPEHRLRLRARVHVRRAFVEPVDVDDHGQRLDEAPVAELGLSRRLLGLLLGRDVEHDPLPQRAAGRGVLDDHRVVAEPEHAPVPVVHPVLGVEGLPGHLGRSLGREHARAVGRVTERPPQVGIGEELRRREPKHPDRLRGDVRRALAGRAPRVVHLGIRDRGHLLDERPVVDLAGAADLRWCLDLLHALPRLRPRAWVVPT